MRCVKLVLICLLLSACAKQSSIPVEKYRHAEDGAMAANVSADASIAVVSGVSGAILVWDLIQNERRFQWSHQGEDNPLVANIHIAANNSHVVTADRGAFALWSLESGEPIGFWRIDESSIRDVAVSNNGRGILVGRGNGKAMYFEPQQGRRIEFLGHQNVVGVDDAGEAEYSGKINSVDISPNGRYAITGGNDYSAYLWDTSTGQVIHRFTHPSRVTKVALDDKGRYAFTADSKNQAQIWDIQSGQAISKLRFIQRQKIFSEAIFSDDGQFLLTGSPSRRVNLWEVRTGKEVHEWRVTPRKGSPMRTAVVYGVGFLSDSQVLSESSSGLAEIWSTE